MIEGKEKYVHKLQGDIRYNLEQQRLQNVPTSGRSFLGVFCNVCVKRISSRVNVGCVH